MAYLIWLVIFSLFIFSYLTTSIPLWIPFVVYLLVVSVRVNEKIGNHRDWVRKNIIDEKRKLEEVTNEMEKRDLTFSGARLKAENAVKEDFGFVRREKIRKFSVDLVDSLFLK